MSRTKAREIALHLVFEMGFQPFEEEALSGRLDKTAMASIGDDMELYAGRLDEEQARYIRQVVKGVSAERDALDQTIEAYLKGWKFSRLSRMTVAILRLALYEMRHIEDVPVSVAINQAVELAKRYDSEDAAAFINGILGSAARADSAPAAEQNDG